MGALRDSWCFCNGGSKPEKLRAALLSGKVPGTVRICSGSGMSGTGFLIHRNLLVTTHGNVPSVAAAEVAEIWTRSGGIANLCPHKFFISSSVLDLTIVGIDVIDGDSCTHGQQSHCLKSCSKPNLELGSVVYLLGYTETNEMAVGEGNVVIATDNLIKLSANGVTLSPGSAGFDAQGNLAFMVCDPMKLTVSPSTKSSSTSSYSSTSLKIDLSMQFGIPMPIIRDWLNQHWEGNLDELKKPKLPLIQLVSSGLKSENSCVSFITRRVFKSTEPRDEGTSSSSSRVLSKTKDDFDNGTMSTRGTTHVQRIPTPEIYESRKLISVPVRKKDISLIQLLNINFPHKLANYPVLPHSIKKLTPFSDETHVKDSHSSQPPSRKEDKREVCFDMADANIVSTGSVSRHYIVVQSSLSPIRILEEQIEYSSDRETTMYSAETAESRNYQSPIKERLQQTRKSQSCVNYNRWEAVQKYPLARKAVLEKQRSFIQGRKIHSQRDSSQKSNNDYYTPTVSSIMKKRANSIQSNRTRPSVVHSSPPRWMF